MMIYLHLILLSILIKISFCAKFREIYADETSWSFQHPSTRYKKVEINGEMVQSLSTIPMNASSGACDTQCAIYCNTVECCNVAKCNINDNTCSVGLHNHPIEYARGESYMVREQHMVGISVLQCPWITPTNTDDVVQCYDGSFCNKNTKGWNCCETRQGIMKCPKNHPKRCASTDCLGNSYHCCRSDCKNYGGDKECLQCKKTWNGGCNEFSSLLLEANNDRKYSVQECYQKCKATQFCAGFFIGINDGICDLYKTGCTPSTDTRYNYYSMDTCSGAVALEFEEIDGNGFCADSNGNTDVSKLLFTKMSHEEARKICLMDDGCVAYSYSLNNMLRDNSKYNNVIIYTNTMCTAWCGYDSWQKESNLILQTKNNGQWDDGHCYIKRSYDYYLNKCITNP